MEVPGRTADRLNVGHVPKQIHKMMKKPPKNYKITVRSFTTLLNGIFQVYVNFAASHSTLATQITQMTRNLNFPSKKLIAGDFCGNGATLQFISNNELFIF